MFISILSLILSHAHGQGSSWKAPNSGNHHAAAASRTDWWSLFQDENLRDLIHSVDVSSPQLAAAMQRVQQARARMNGARSMLFPTLDADVGAISNRYSAALDNSFPSRNTNQFEVGLTASYELDLWGRIRNSVSSARSTMLAEKAVAESLRLSIHAEITDAYLMLRGVEAELSAVNEVNRGRRVTLDLTQKRASVGTVSDFELEQVRADLAAADAEAASLSQIRMEMENVIALLAGRNATNFKIAQTAQLPNLPKVPSIIPGELLRRRPDVAAIDRRLDSAFADIQSTRAEQYPTVKLEAGAGLTASRLSNLDRNAAQEGSIGLKITLPVFDGGRRKAKIEEAKAIYSEQLQSQRQQVLAAVADAEISLGKVHWSNRQSQLAARSAEAATRVAELSMKRFEAGNIDTFQHLQVDRVRLEASRIAIRARTSELRASVALIRALGGGWTTSQNSTNR